MTVALELNRLTAGHNKVPVVRGLSLTVAAGEIVALIGPNGAGKSTTLDTICGILPALGGEIQAFGEPITSLRDATRQGLAYVPEHRGLFRGLTVHENLRLRARTSSDVDQTYLRFPVLGALRRRQSALLSGGEQQLLSLACALALRPRLLLVDEMTIGLAPTVIRDLTPVVKEVAAEGVAVLFVEQHVHLALEMCDRAYVLNHGECVMEGDGEDLRTRVDEVSAAYLSSPTPG